jgi:hypothetical protein
MRNLHHLDPYRLDTTATHGSLGDHYNGAFRIRSHAAPNQTMVVLASRGEGWDHVSVSLKRRCPWWPEMEQIKHLFFEPHETVMQLHVPASDHISYHPYALHLWRPLDAKIPRPPGWMVGPKAAVGKEPS